MRIFQAIDGSANSKVPDSKTWLRNLHEPLIDLGHDVVLFSTTDGRKAMIHKDKKLLNEYSQKMLEVFKKEYNKKPFDLFFSYLMDGMISPEAIDDIRRFGVPTCNFSCNNMHQFYLVKEISSHFDYNLHSEKNMGYKFLEVGAKPVWWPMASNPKYFKPIEGLLRDTDVSFVGGNYGIRARYAYNLLENGIDAHMYGPGWQYGAQTPFRAVAKRVIFCAQAMVSRDVDAQARGSAMLAAHDFRRRVRIKHPQNVHAPVTDEKLISLYSSSKISLGITAVFDGHDPSKGIVRHLHLREFEAPMCGALYCTEYSAELAEMFEPDEEVLVYKDEEELTDKIRFYLKESKAAEKIRAQGHQRALKDHTYHKRFETLFRKIGTGK